MIERKETTSGAILYEDGHRIGYELGSTFNGECFKDMDAFNNDGDACCYISEFEFDELLEDIDSLTEDFHDGKITTEEFIKDKEELVKHAGWTRNQLVELVGGKGFEKVAEYVLEIIDWQSPYTYWNEYEFEPSDLETFGLTWEMVEKEWGINRKDYKVAR